jgi:hypothetical protein
VIAAIEPRTRAARDRTRRSSTRTCAPAYPGPRGRGDDSLRDRGGRGRGGYCAILAMPEHGSCRRLDVGTRCRSSSGLARRRSCRRASWPAISKGQDGGGAHRDGRASRRRSGGVHR